MLSAPDCILPHKSKSSRWKGTRDSTRLLTKLLRHPGRARLDGQDSNKFVISMGMPLSSMLGGPVIERNLCPLRQGSISLDLGQPRHTDPHSADTGNYSHLFGPNVLCHPTDAVPLQPPRCAASRSIPALITIRNRTGLVRPDFGYRVGGHRITGGGDTRRVLIITCHGPCNNWFHLHWRGGTVLQRLHDPTNPSLRGTYKSTPKVINRVVARTVPLLPTILQSQSQ